jgi:hypothetical protein
MDTKYDLADLKSGKAFRSNYGSHAKGITEFYHKLHPYLLEHDAHLLIVNQTRARIDDDAENASKWSYTNREYSLPGGYEARFTPSVMIEEILESEIRLGNGVIRCPRRRRSSSSSSPRVLSSRTIRQLIG